MEIRQIKVEITDMATGKVYHKIYPVREGKEESWIKYIKIAVGTCLRKIFEINFPLEEDAA